MIGVLPAVIPYDQRQGGTFMANVKGPLHDIRVIDEPMKNSAGTFSGSVKLKSGWHPIRLYYRHAGSRKQLELTCQSRDGMLLKLDAATLRQSEGR